MVDDIQKVKEELNQLDIKQLTELLIISKILFTLYCTANWPMFYISQPWYCELMELESETPLGNKQEKKNSKEEYDQLTKQTTDYGIWMLKKHDEQTIKVFKKKIIELLGLMVNIAHWEKSWGNYDYIVKAIVASIYEFKGLKKTLMLQTYGAIVYTSVNNKPVIIDGIRWPQTIEIERRLMWWAIIDSTIPNKTPEPIDPDRKKTLKERADQYEQKYTKLSDDDFNTEFNKKDFQQWYIGNCYFLSMLRWLMENTYYSTLIKTSVYKEQAIWYDGQSINIYKVSLPLGEPWAKAYTVYPEDLWKGVTWAIWIQVLEAAYIKHVTWENTIDDQTIWKARWWLPNEAMRTIGGRENIWASKDVLVNDTANTLLQFDPQHDIVCVGTHYQWWKTDSDSYHITNYPQYSFLYNHAYTVLQVDKTWSTINRVMISNPHDAWKGYRIPYYVFYYGFFSVFKWKINQSNAFNESTNHRTILPEDNKREKKMSYPS